MDRVLHLTAENLNRLLGLAGEALVESRWLRPFAESLHRLKRMQTDLERTLDGLRQSSDEERLAGPTRENVNGLFQQVTEAQQFLNARMLELDLYDRRAANLSNRYYTVHPRRNDRFLGATPLLKALFRDIDFTDFSFTRHMLFTLYAQSPDRFAVLADELRATWTARMKDLMSRLPKRTMLLWIADQAPQSPARGALDQEPILVDCDMMTAVCPMARTYLEVISRPENRGQGLGSMTFAPTEAQAAAAVPGPEVHRDVSRLVAKALENALR